jgi:hypothetical protein
MKITGYLLRPAEFPALKLITVSEPVYRFFRHFGKVEDGMALENLGKTRGKITSQAFAGTGFEAQLQGKKPPFWFPTPEPKLQIISRLLTEIKGLKKFFYPFLRKKSFDKRLLHSSPLSIR